MSMTKTTDTNAKFVKFADDTTVITSTPTLQEASVSLVRLSMDDCRPYIYFELIYPRIIAYNHTYTCTPV